MPNVVTCQLATVFSVSNNDTLTITADWILSRLKIYNLDDVFENAFLELVVLAGMKLTRVEITEEARTCLGKLRNLEILIACSTDLLPGPYAVRDGKLRDVWKLYEDSNETCMTTLKPQSK